MNNKLINKMYSLLSNKLYFKILYLFVSFSFITALTFVPGINILTKVSILWGLVLLPITLIERLWYKNTIKAYEIPLLIFIIVTLVFNVLKYPTMENIKLWLINTMILVVFFSPSNIKSKHNLENEITVFSWVYVALSSVFSIISVVMIFLNTSIQIPGAPIDGMPTTITYKGFFASENAFGIAAIISIIFTLYLLHRSEKASSKILLFVNLILQGLSVVISSGRSAYLILLSLIFVFIFVYIKNIWIKLFSIILPIGVIFALFTYLPQYVHYVFTGRQNIWRAAFRVIKDNPIYGVGNSLMVPKIDAARDIWLYGVEAGGLHNIYIEIATVNGIVSALLILLFIVFTFFYLVNSISKLSAFSKFSYSILLSLFVGLAVVNLMESTLLYKVSFISIVFWTIGSYLVSLVDKSCGNTSC